MSFEPASANGLENLKPVRHRTSSLSIHPYFGKVDPAIVQWALTSFTSEGDRVLDPFCGSGTVLHEAVAARRHAVGWDSSPLAALIAAAKLLGINKSEEGEISQALAPLYEYAMGGLFARPFSFNPESIPTMSRIRSITSWFGENALRELAFLRHFLQEAREQISSESFLLMQIAFSRIITAASRQEGESSYRRIEKPDHVGRVLKLYLTTVQQVLKDAAGFAESTLDGEPRKERLNRCEHAYRIRHPESNIEIVEKDSRRGMKPKGPGAALVVTSPPYLMSWDYGLYHKFRFYWLGFDLDAYEATEIGRHLRRQGDDVERYQQDMRATMEVLHSHTAKGGHAVIVNATSVVYGREVDTSQIIDDAAKVVGWRSLGRRESLDIPGPHHGMYASLGSRGASAPGAAGKKETVLVFERL